MDELVLMLGEMGVNVDAVIRVAAVEASAPVAELADPAELLLLLFILLKPLDVALVGVVGVASRFVAAATADAELITDEVSRDDDDNELISCEAVEFKLFEFKSDDVTI